MDSNHSFVMPTRSANVLEDYFSTCAISDADCPDIFASRPECFARRESECTGFDYSDRYDNASASWVMTCAILMFFMKAGFLYVEIAFSKSDIKYRRKVVFSKYVDVFAGTFGFWLFGYAVSGNTDAYALGEMQDYIFWFFRFTFASNTATIIGGTLVGNKTQLRSIAIFLYSFIMSAFIHPGLARFFWSNARRDQRALTWSPFDYCNGTFTSNQEHTFDWFKEDLGNFVFIDFGGAGLVHICGGFGSLVLSIFHKIECTNNVIAKHCRQCCCSTSSKCTSCYDRQDHENTQNSSALVQQEGSEIKELKKRRLNLRNFFEYVYPTSGGEEYIESAALGILILWTTWFAYNAGATESISSKALHASVGRIALTMCLACAASGLTQVLLSSMVHFIRNDEHFTTNEIANAILGALVSVTGCCPFIDPEWAIFIGGMAVFFFHLGCFIEFIFGLHDGARVFPVHGMCGVWGVLCVGIFSKPCLIRELYEDVCYCLHLSLPSFLNENENQALLFAYQLAGAVFIITWSVVLCGLVFLILFYIPAAPFASFFLWCKTKCSQLHQARKRKRNGQPAKDEFRNQSTEMNFEGTLLFTNLNEMRTTRAYVKDERYEPNEQRTVGQPTVIMTNEFAELERDEIKDDESKM